MSETTIAAGYFKFNGIKYFRRMSEEMALGVSGQKKTPLLGIPYVSPEGRMRPALLEGSVKVTGPITIDWSQSSGADVDANGALKYFDVNVKSALSGGYEKAKSAQLRLIKLSIAEAPLKRALNQADTVRGHLAREGADARIVSSVFILLTGKLAESFETSASHQVSVSKGEAHLELGMSGGSYGAQTIELPPGVFAFGLHKVSNWSKGKEQVLDLTEDFVG